MRLLSIICLILACYTTTTSQNNILGPDNVCETSCHTYSVNTTEEVYWTITGGIVEDNVGTSIEICWEEAQAAEINVTSLNNQFSADLNVSISELPNPLIIFPAYPICSKQDSLNFQEEFVENDFCQTVCGGETSILEIASLNASSNYTWEVLGDNNNTETFTGIEIEWPEEGYGSVILMEENDAGCVDSIYYCIEILTKPSVDITHINTEVDLSSVCQNQDILLQGDSDQNLSFSWTSSDGQIGSGNFANFSFENTGVYDITLTGVTNCFCVVEETIQIEVIDFISPHINCVGPICASEEMTYYATDICGSYNWSVGPNGTVLEGGNSTDNFITVQWASGPYGILSLATSSCDDSAICTTPAIEYIPVIGSQVSISGPDEVCNDGVTTFTTQQYDGADYNWSIDNLGSIVSGNGTNEITVQWSPWINNINTAVISVDIEHCFLGCSSTGEKTVKVEEPFAISSQPSYCENATGYFTAFAGYNSVDTDWFIVTPDNQIEPIASNYGFPSIVFDDGPGIYEVVATAVSDDYCNTEERTFIEVFEAPDPITEIEGPELLCVGEAIAYSIKNPNAAYDYKWTISDGTDNTLLYNDEIFYQWTSAGPYSLSVVVTDPETSCSSEEFSKTFTTPTSLSIDGDQTPCTNETVEYLLLGVSSTNIEWSLTPSDVGIIIPGDDNAVNVQWFEEQNAILTANYCGNSFDLNIDVIDDGFDYDHESSVCEGETTNINFNNGTTVVAVEDETGAVIGTTNPVIAVPGFYAITTTGPNGCIDETQTYIGEDPSPAVNLSSPNLNRLCMPGGSATLDALTTNEVSSYEWFREGVNLNMNTPSIMVTQDGQYTVEVINEKRCTGSDIFTVECVESICDCRPDGGVAFTYQRDLFCNEFSFTNTSFDYIPGTLTYYFNDFGVTPNTSTNENPSFTFSEAGHFIVELRGIVPHATDPALTCPAIFVEFITVEAVSEFTNNPSCEGESMEFFENVNFVPGVNIASYDWNFGDPTSGSDNNSTDPDPKHNYAVAGDYDVTLVITTDTGCQSVITKTVTVNPLPNVDFDIPVSVCVDEAIQFIGITDGFDVTWDFGTAPGQFVNSLEAYHSFSAPGPYPVSLLANNIYGCQQRITKTINVVDNPFNGEITVDQTMPMCEGVVATLDGPAGGFAYLWSNGETTESISTELPGIYEVTVTSNDGCQYIPEPLIVNTIRPINPIISAYLNTNVNFAASFSEQIEICEGESVRLFTPYISGATFTWSDGQSGNFLTSINLDNLAPGEYVYTVTVTDPTFNCDIESEPFTVIVNPRPDPFQIESDQLDHCEGVTFTFGIVNPDPALNYYWNNGMAGESITVSTAGVYYAEAFNEYGCSRSSNAESIHPLPHIGRVLTGCQEACFPDTLCIATSSDFTTYTWFLDGVPVAGADQDELIINEVGDYQVELVNAFGCTITSDVLTITPKTNEQSLEGLVYIDDNGNGAHDTGEELITGATVSIISGSTILESQTTDNNGTYLFDPMPTSDADVFLDTVGLNLNLSNSTLLYSFELKSCNEELVQDFPLNKICQPDNFDLTLFTCVGEPVEYEGIFYVAGDNMSVSIFDNSGCESFVNLEVLAYPAIDYQLLTSPTCDNESAGIVTIDISSGNGLQFSIDNGLTFTNNPEFNNLTSGTYDLMIMDENECMANDVFTISEHNSPTVTFVPSNTCVGEDNGSISIDVSASANMEFAIDDNSVFTQLAMIPNLSAGDHVLYVLDEFGCTHEYDFTVGVYAEPEFTFDPYNSCSGQDQGSLSITTSELGLTFSMNGVDYSDVLNYPDLPVGDYTLHALTADGCHSSYDFSISTFGLIDIDTEVQPACYGQSNGEITINAADNIQVSLDGLTYESLDNIADLSPGDYILYAQDENTCPTEYMFTIEELEEVEVAYSEPVIDCSTTELELNVENLNGTNLEYTWSNGETGNSIMVQQAGLYEVIISNGCEIISHAWDILFESTPDATPAFVPNIFSPESLDMNAEFKPMISEEITLQEYQFSIFDRWGNKLFYTDDYHDYWDGSYLDKFADPGVFIWKIEMKYSDCQETKSFEQFGDVTLVR